MVWYETKRQHTYSDTDFINNTQMDIFIVFKIYKC